MGCYIIRLPQGISPLLLQDLGIPIKDSFSCVNCFTAELQQWQVKELTKLGAELTFDSTCSL